MEHKYLIKKVGKYIKFKLDQNPITKEFEPHIWQRHTVTVEDAIRAFFTISEEDWNEKYKRFEAYSQRYNTTLYYMERYIPFHNYGI